MADNDYAATWTEMVRRTGAIVVPLTWYQIRVSPRGGRTLVQFQWPEFDLASRSRVIRFGKSLKLLSYAAVARSKANRVLLSMHNVVPHTELGVTGRLFWRGLTRLTSEVHVMSRSALPDIYGQWPSLRSKPVQEIPHVIYSTTEIAVEPAHDSAQNILFFGSIRGYKGVDDLVRAFSEVRGPVTLRICGRPDTAETAERLRRAARSDNRIKLHLRRLSDEELASEISSADLVALPFRKILNSGSAIHALSYGTAILVPNTPTFEELSERAGAEWVNLFQGALSAADIEVALARERQLPPNLEWCSSEAVTARIALMLNRIA